MTRGQVSFSAVCGGPRTGLLWRLLVTLQEQTAQKRCPRERQTGPRTERLNPGFPHVTSGLGFCRRRRRRLDNLVFKKILKL